MKEKILYSISMLGFLMIAGAMVVPLVQGPYYTGAVSYTHLTLPTT